MRLHQSPFNTKQEEYRDEPWKMMMICMMLNCTSYKQVDQIKDQFFLKYPDAKSIVDSDPEELSEIIKPLGFYNKRVTQWKKFCSEWIRLSCEYDKDSEIPSEKIAELHGVGDYALASWKVFQNYEYDIEVEDHVLVKYVEWAREEKKRITRENSPWLPRIVYYLHYKDERLSTPNFSGEKDHSICLMARTIEEAIEKAKEANKGKHIKIVGVVPGRMEWITPN